MIICCRKSSCSKQEAQGDEATGEMRDTEEDIEFESVDNQVETKQDTLRANTSTSNNSSVRKLFHPTSPQNFQAASKVSSNKLLPKTSASVQSNKYKRSSPQQAGVNIPSKIKGNAKGMTKAHPQTTKASSSKKNNFFSSKPAMNTS